MIKTSTSKVTFTYQSDTTALIDVLIREGKFDEARQLCETECEGDEKTALLLNRATVERSAGNCRLALAILESVETDNKLLRGNLHNEMGICCRRLGRLDRAIIEYSGASDYYRQVGHDYYLARTLNNIGNCLIDLNRLDEAHALIDRAEKDITDPPSLAHLQHTRARAFLAQGMLPEALHYAALSVSMLATLGEVAAMKEPKKLLAELLDQ